MKRRMIIAVAQSRCVPGDVEGNIDRMKPLVRDAAHAGARIVLFSEGGVTGYEAAPRSLSRAVTIGDETCKRLHALARQYNTVIAVGFLERNGAKVHVSHGAFFPDGRIVVQRKARNAPTEQSIAGIEAGPEERTVFEVDGVRCAMSICADTGIDDLWNKLARAGVQVHLVPTAGCGPRSLGFSEAELDDPKRMEEYLKKAESVVWVKDAIVQCRRHRIILVACNQMADDGVGYFHPGHSCIVDTTGELVGLIPGSFVFEHLRPRVVWGEIHPQTPLEFRAS